MDTSKIYRFRNWYSTSFLCLLLTMFTRAQVTSNGNQNQNVGTNNGLVIQVNVGPSKEKAEHVRKEMSAAPGIGGNWQATLIPGSSKIPDSPANCVPPPGSLVIRLGSGEGGSTIFCEKQECNALRTPDTTLVRLFRRGTAVQIETRVFGPDGRILAEIADNKLYVNPNTTFRWSRPDSHTIEVIDQQDRNALSVRFANPSTVLIEGVFYDRVGDRLEILPNEMKVGQVSFSGSCGGNPGGAGFSFGKPANPTGNSQH